VPCEDIVREEDTQFIIATAAVGKGKYNFSELFLNKTNIKDYVFLDNLNCNDSETFLDCLNKNNQTIKAYSLYLDGEYSQEELERKIKYVMSGSYVNVPKYDILVYKPESIQNLDLYNKQPCENTGALTTPAPLQLDNLNDYKTKAVEIDFVAAQGLYIQRSDDDGDVYIESFSISTQVIILKRDSNGNLIKVKDEVVTLTGSSAIPIRRTFRFELDEAGQYYIQFKNLTKNDSSCEGKKTDSQRTKAGSVVIENVKSILTTTNKFRFDDTTLLVFKLLINESLGQQNSLKISVKANRVGLSKLKDVVPYIYNKSKLPNLTNSFQLNDEVNVKLDSKKSVYDWLTNLLRPRFYYIKPTLSGFEIEKFRDNKPVVAVFDTNNIKKGSLKFTASPLVDFSYDCYEGVYYAENGEKMSEFYPVRGYYPQKIDVFGLNNQNDVAAYLRMLWYQKIKENESCELVTTLEGLTVELGDRVKILDIYDNDFIFNSKILDITNNKIFVLDDFEHIYNQEESYFLLVKSGEKIESFSIIGVNRKEIELDRNIDIELEGANFVILKNEGSFKDFYVKEISPQDKNEVKLKLLKYSDEPYTHIPA